MHWQKSAITPRHQVFNLKSHHLESALHGSYHLLVILGRLRNPRFFLSAFRGKWAVASGGLSLAMDIIESEPTAMTNRGSGYVPLT
jgi:hypothetical protein